MKKLSDDLMTKRIKEVMEQYEPDYSPQFWEKIREQRPVPELQLKTRLLKYKFWLSVFFITGVIILTYRDSNLLPGDTYSVPVHLYPESFNYPVSEEAREITYLSPGITSASGNIIYDNNSIGDEEKITSSKVTPERITDPLASVYHDSIPDENAIADIPGGLVKITVPVALEEIDFGYHYNPTGLIPIEYQTEDTKPLKAKAYNNKSDNTRKLIFHWPDFSSQKKKGDYGKFTGPNKLAFFYSPEIHFNGSFGEIGVSQGIGINVEGPVRSLISVSAGLSFQAINFHDKTLFSGLVPPLGPFQPIDTIRTFYYVDSIVFISGSYKFLELPVSVNYKFIENARSQVWLGAGISAIAFLRQNYTYDIVVEGTSKSSDVSIKAWENIHPLASLNLSLIYRYNLSYRSLLHGSVQYKQHLVPLGYNSMKLNRLNFQVGMIYRFGHAD